MKLIRAGLINEIGDAAARLAVFCRIIRHLHLEFANGIRARTEFIKTSATEVVASNRDAVNEDFMAEQLPAINRPRKCIADSSGKTGEDESLELPSSITHLNWQSLELLSAYCRAHFRRGRREERRLRCDFHPLRLVANLQREIDRHHLRDWHKNAFGYFSLETLLLCLQAISAGGHSHPVVAGTACFCRPLHVGFNVRNGERGVGNNGSTRVQNRTGDGTEVTLPRRRARKQKKSATEQHNHADLTHTYLLAMPKITRNPKHPRQTGFETCTTIGKQTQRQIKNKMDKERRRKYLRVLWFRLFDAPDASNLYSAYGNGR